jgi:hypothetical protein
MRVCRKPVSSIRWTRLATKRQRVPVSVVLLRHECCVSRGSGSVAAEAVAPFQHDERAERVNPGRFVDALPRSSSSPAPEPDHVLAGNPAPATLQPITSAAPYKIVGCVRAVYYSLRIARPWTTASRGLDMSDLTVSAEPPLNSMAHSKEALVRTAFDAMGEASPRSMWTTLFWQGARTAARETSRRVFGSAAARR